MNMIYNSPHYCVVEFAAQAPDETPAFSGGYEIVDKVTRREIFIEGMLAQSFRERVQALVEGEPTVEDFDDFLGGFSTLMQHPVVLH